MLKDVPVLIPRTYLVTGYDGTPRLFTYKKADAASVARTVNEQLKAGLRIPVCWMHDPDAEPQYLSHKSPEYVAQWRIANGYIGDVKKAYTRDGNTYAVVEITDPDDLKRFDKIGTVSPSLVSNWTDERGKTWPGLNMLHVGVTPKPIQRDLPRARAYRPTSRTDAVWFSITIPTGSQAMNDEMDDKASGEGELIAKAVDLLKKANLNLAGDITDVKTFLVALETAVNTLHGEDEMDDDMDMDVTADADGTEAVTPPMMLSWAPKLAEALDVKVQADLALLKAKVDDGTVARLTREWATVNLSHEPARHFDRNGELKAKPSVLTQIEAYKLLPDRKDKFDKANLSQTVPVHPVDRKPDGKIMDAAEMLAAYAKGQLK